MKIFIVVVLEERDEIESEEPSCVEVLCWKDGVPAVYADKLNAREHITYMEKWHPLAEYKILEAYV